MAHFDKNNDGVIDYDEFLVGIRVSFYTTKTNIGKTKLKKIGTC